MGRQSPLSYELRDSHGLVDQAFYSRGRLYIFRGTNSLWGDQAPVAIVAVSPIIDPANPWGDGIEAFGVYDASENPVAAVIATKTDGNTLHFDLGRGAQALGKLIRTQDTNGHAAVSISTADQSDVLPHEILPLLMAYISDNQP